MIDPARSVDRVQDLWIEHGRILGAPQQGQVPESAEIMDLTGHWITPGFIDLHTHLREPGQEYKEDIASGLRAAAAGGFTTICTMANTRPVNDNKSITLAMKERAREVGGTRMIPFGAITRGLRGEELADMGELREAGVPAISDDGRCVTDSALMLRALEYASNFDMLVIQHCEDHCLTQGAQMHDGPTAHRLGLRGWPREAEDIIVARDIILAGRTRSRYHVAHISSKGSLPWIKEAKDRGLRVTAEVTPHHLALTDAAVVGYNTFCKVNPPLREEQDRAALVQALQDGTIDCIATDHAPHSSMEKECEFEQASVGINGLETALGTLLALVRNGELSATRLVEALTTSAARCLPDLPAPSLADGAPADLTVIAPDLEWSPTKNTLRSRSHNTPWLDQRLRGVVTRTMVGGNWAHIRPDHD